MKFSQRVIFMVLLSSLPALVQAQHAAKLQGAWELVSQKENGQDHPVVGRQVKLLTADHYAWARQDKKLVEEQLAKGTQRDSIEAFRDAYGVGTYKVVGDTYTETTEFFYLPQYIGKSVDFKFTLKGDTWVISGQYSHYEGDKKVNTVLLEQTYKRIK